MLFSDKSIPAPLVAKIVALGSEWPLALAYTSLVITCSSAFVIPCSIPKRCKMGTSLLVSDREYGGETSVSLIFIFQVIVLTNPAPSR